MSVNRKLFLNPMRFILKICEAKSEKTKFLVRAIFFKNGTLKVENVSSTMPKEFDRAAAEAAEKIKFEPAIHKKSKQPVSQEMTIEYNFKP